MSLETKPNGECDCFTLEREGDDTYVDSCAICGEEIRLYRVSHTEHVSHINGKHYDDYCVLELAIKKIVSGEWKL